jgi:hypothetical protein
MYSKSQFYALELLCRQRAAVARKEMEYWLNEAEEWTQLLNIAPSPSPLHAVESKSMRPLWLTETVDCMRFDFSSLVR